VLYNALSLWSTPGRASRLPIAPSGRANGTVSDPANALGALAGKAHMKYCEAKAVIGGTTAI